jgi:hypothetical protein
MRQHDYGRRRRGDSLSGGNGSLWSVVVVLRETFVACESVARFITRQFKSWTSVARESVAGCFTQHLLPYDGGSRLREVAQSMPVHNIVR